MCEMIELVATDVLCPFRYLRFRVIPPAAALMSYDEER